MKIIKKQQDEPYQKILAFSEMGELSLFENKNYKVSVSIRLNLSLMHLVVSFFDANAHRKCIQANVLSHSWLESIRESGLPEIRSVADTKLRVSRTTTLHLCMGEYCTIVNLDVVKELIIPVLLAKTFIDRSIKLIPGQKKNSRTTLPTGTDLNCTRATV